jgi:nitrate/TMAO reductase-like tetraheme cytochrome c subunit
MWFLPLLVSLFLGGSSAAVAQGAEECLACHGEKDLTMERRGRTVSLYVNQAELGSSPHARVSCVDCHRGLKADELPHAPRIRPVNCLSCHDDEKFLGFAASVHGQAQPGVTCAACHGGHSTRKVTDKDAATPPRAVRPGLRPVPPR